MEEKYIGDRKIKEIKELEEETSGGFKIVEVKFEDGKIEHFSSLLYDKIVSKTPCDASELRDKRVFPIVEMVLSLLRDWGIKINELTYMSALLNRSLDVNTKEALNELWSQWIPKPTDPEDVDLIAIDRVLKSRRKTLNDIIENIK